MAGHIQDRWYKSVPGPDGKTVRVKTERYGVGHRYRARYIAPDGSYSEQPQPTRPRLSALRRVWWRALCHADVGVAKSRSAAKSSSRRPILGFT